MTPLMFAAYYGHLEIVEVLADGGAKLDLHNSDKQTALWYVACSIHPADMTRIAVVRLLVDRGADQTIKGGGMTPREIAVKKGYTECAELLR